MGRGEDRVRLVADARAQMMLRGWEPLMLVVGPHFLRGLWEDMRETGTPDPAQVGASLGIHVAVDDGMEGFRVAGMVQKG